MLIEIEIPFGKLEAAGEPEQINRTVCFRRAHVQGLNRGALGYAGLNAIGAEFLREAQVDAVVIERGARTTGAGAKRGRRPPPAAIPVELVLRAAEAIDLILRRGLAVA